MPFGDFISLINVFTQAYANTYSRPRFESSMTICEFVDIDSSSHDLSSISTKEPDEPKGKSLMRSSDLDEAIFRGDWEAFEREAKAIFDCTALSNDSSIMNDRAIGTGASLVSSSSEISSLHEGGNLQYKVGSLSQESCDEDLTSSDEDDIDCTKFAEIEKMIDDDDFIGLANHASLSLEKSSK